MTTEVCPFCGKTYKRLKSHLPHCKAATTTKKPLTIRDATASQPLSCHATAATAKTTTQGKTYKQTSSLTTDLQAEKRKKVSASPTLANASSSSQLTSSSPSTAAAAKKSKPKAVDQVKSTDIFSSPPLSTTFLKPKKKSLRALIEAAKSDHVAKESLKGTKCASKESSQSSRTSELTEIKTDRDLENNCSLSISTDSKKKGPKMKNVTSTIKHTSDYVDFNVNANATSRHDRDSFWVDSDEGIEGNSETKLLLKSGSAPQVKVTLQDVKATLGRTNTHRQSSRSSILSHITAADSLIGKIKPDVDHVQLHEKNQKDAVSSLVTPTILSDKLFSEQHTELQLFHKTCKQSALIPRKQDAAHQLEPTAPAASFLSACASQVQQATPSPAKLNLNERLRVGHHMTRLPSISASLGQLSSPPLSLAASQTLARRVGELQLKIKKQNLSKNPNEGTLTQQSLGQVKLKELPKWLVRRTPCCLGEAVDLVQGGWLWYYRKYIDVKKGGVAGLSMMLAGYCVLSYIWSYPHIKSSRWRKYH